MREDPDIIRILKKEERLGLLKTQSQDSYEELETPGEVFEDMQDKSISVMKGSVEADNLFLDDNKKTNKILDAISDWICIINKDQRILYSNTAVEKIIGIPKSEIIGENCCKVVHGSEKPPPECSFKRMLHSHNRENLEIQIPDRNRWLKVTVDPLKDEKGNITGAVHIIRDTTERKKAEEELLRLSNAVKMSNDSIVISDLNGNIIDVNEATLRMYGTKVKKDLIGKNSFDLIASEEREKALAGMTEVLEKGYVKDRKYHIVTGDGYRIPVEMSVSIMNDVNGKPVGFVGITRDITARKKAEEVLQKSEEKFRSIFEEVKDSLIFLDTTGKILDINEEAVKIFGGSKKEAVGKHFSKLGVVPVEEIQKLLKGFIKVIRGKKLLIEIQIKNKRREIRDLECSANLIKIGKRAEGMMVVARDITDRKWSEGIILRQNIQLKKLNRIKTDFLNITSHELRTPMASIKGYIQMLLKQKLGNLTSEQKDALNVVLRNTNRLDHLIEDILDISRLESGTMKFIPEKTDIKKMIKEVVKTMQSSADYKNIKINTEIGDKIPELIIDQERIKQVLMNIIDNSIKFSAHDSKINIYTKMKKDNILFEIQDFGRGIPKNKQKKIFERFYQVDSGMDRKFGGVGLGLTISKGIIDIHNGKIWVDSTVGKGCSFKFTLPLQSVKNLKDRSKNMDLFSLENNK